MPKFLSLTLPLYINRPRLWWDKPENATGHHDFRHGDADIVVNRFKPAVDRVPGRPLVLFAADAVCKSSPLEAQQHRTAADVCSSSFQDSSRVGGRSCRRQGRDRELHSDGDCDFGVDAPNGFFSHTRGGVYPSNYRYMCFADSTEKVHRWRCGVDIPPLFQHTDAPNMMELKLVPPRPPMPNSSHGPSMLMSLRGMRGRAKKLERFHLRDIGELPWCIPQITLLPSPQISPQTCPRAPAPSHRNRALLTFARCAFGHFDSCECQVLLGVRRASSRAQTSHGLRVVAKREKGVKGSVKESVQLYGLR